MKDFFQGEKEEIWLKPLYQQKIEKKQSDNIKTSQKLWLHNDCGPT